MYEYHSVRNIKFKCVFLQLPRLRSENFKALIMILFLEASTTALLVSLANITQFANNKHCYLLTYLLSYVRIVSKIAKFYCHIVH